MASDGRRVFVARFMGLGDSFPLRGSPRRGRGANFFLLDEDVSQNGTGG